MTYVSFWIDSKRHQSEHSEGEVFSGQEDDVESRSPVSPNQGALPLKAMPAPPPKENAWAKRSTGGSSNAGPFSSSADKQNRWVS